MANKTRVRSKPTASASTKAATKTTKAATPSSQQKPESSVTASPKVSAQQSVQLVQSLLHAGISCVAYLRQLFPEGCFTKRQYENRPEHWDYDDWVAGRKGQVSGHKRSGATVPVLERGAHPEADRILDWLEKGVFDALQKGYLKTFRFQIIQNQDRPSEVLETYDFRVRYAESTGEALVEIGLPDNKPASIWNARLGFTQIIRKLTLYCPSLAYLPRQRSVRIQITYNDSCPRDYEPSGFTPGMSDSLAFPSSDGWARKTAYMGEMVTGRHGLSLKINHLEKRDPAVPETEIPTNLLYDDLITLLDEDTANNVELQDESLNGLPQPPTTSNVPGDKEASDYAEMAYLTNALQDTPADDIFSDTLPLDTIPQEEEFRETDGMELSKQKLVVLERSKQSAAELSSPLKRRSTGIDLQGLGSGDVIKCECDWEEEDAEQMLYCQLCETWQHAFCYGYRGRADPRMPENRLCYRCLATGEEPKLLTQLQSYARIRCGIRYIERFGFTDDSTFAKGLGFDRQNATRLSNFLREKKFLVSLSVPNQTTRAAVQGPLQIVRSGPARRKMMDEYFDPFRDIDYLARPEHQGDQCGRTNIFKHIPRTKSTLQSDPALRPSRKGKQRVTREMSSSASQPAIRPNAPAAIMQTPSRKRRSREEWVEEVGSRVTPKRACKNSVSDGFAHMPSPTGASVDEEAGL